MSAVGKAITEVFNKIEDVTIFFISYTLIVLIIGEFIGAVYAQSEAFWYPVYALFIVLVIKVLMDMSRKGKK